MRGAILDGARLNGAVLGRRHTFFNQRPPYTATDLTAASLRGTQFRGANLHGVNFTEANLSGADLSEVNLTGGKMIRTLIIGTVMRGAHLRAADFSGARGGTIEQFQEASLTSANMNHHAMYTKPTRLPEAIAQDWVLQEIEHAARTKEANSNER
jgi:uncharacterized protein YjbI with pentapeptide repeats